MAPKEPPKPPPNRPLPRLPGENIIPEGVWSNKPDTRGLFSQEPEPEPEPEEPKEPEISFEGTEISKKYNIHEEITRYASVHSMILLLFINSLVLEPLFVVYIEPQLQEKNML